MISIQVERTLNAPIERNGVGARRRIRIGRPNVIEDIAGYFAATEPAAEYILR